MEEHPHYARQAPEPPVPMPTSDPVVPPPFGSAKSLRGVFIMFFLMMLGMILVGGLVHFWFGFAFNAFSTELVVILLPILAMIPKTRRFSLLKLSHPPTPMSVLVGMIGVLGLAMVLTEWSYWSDKVLPMPEIIKQAYLQVITAHSMSELLILVFVVGLVPGLCEEVAFRGYFQQVFQYRFGTHQGIFVAASLFALMHMDPWHLPALFAIGVFLGYLFLWTGSLWVPVIAHFTNNAASVIMVYVAPESEMSQIAEAPPLWALLGGAIVFVLSIRWFRSRFVPPVENRVPVHSAADSLRAGD